MKKHFFLSAILIGVLLAANAQTGTGTSNPNAAAKLDVSSTTSGFLALRMNLQIT